MIQPEEIIIFNKRIQMVFTMDEIALSSFIHNMIEDCRSDSQAIDLSQVDKIQNISDSDLMDFIALWKYVETPNSKSVLTKLELHDPSSASESDSIITQLADNKPLSTLCKLIIIANFLGIDPLIKIYASRIACHISNDI